jgi:copper chaperone CopZ
MLKQTFHIADMHCSNCAIILESLEDKLPGVKRVSASYAKGKMVVEYDESVLSTTDILAAVSKLGYQASE